LCNAEFVVIYEKVMTEKRKKTKQFFRKKVLMECYRGSIAHGLYLDPKDEFGTDDVDKLVVFTYPKHYYLSLHGYLRESDVFEKKKGKNDIVGYELRKMFYLLSKSNPNVLLTLWLKREHYLTLTPAWEKMISNRKLFLSKEGIYNTFLGYAKSQLKKMEYFQKQGYMGEKRAKLVKRFGYDSKNASHLIRLLKMGIEVLENGELKVFRDKDRDELLSIKKGEWSLEKIKKESDLLFKKLESAFSKSKLPEKVDVKKIDNLLLQIMDLALKSQKSEVKESADLNVPSGRNDVNYAFVDSQNVNLAIQDQGWKLDFRRFKIYLKEKYNVVKAFLFIGFIHSNQDLYSFLQDAGYILVFKPTLTMHDGSVKGNVDGELILHTMIEFDNYNKAVIVTGDGDFYCLVDYLSKKNKLLKLLVPNVHKYSRLLKPFAPNKLDFMNNLRNKLEYKRKSNKKERQLHKDETL
jgi:predicted nucleotidyltransferase